MIWNLESAECGVATTRLQSRPALRLKQRSDAFAEYRLADDQAHYDASVSREPVEVAWKRVHTALRHCLKRKLLARLPGGRAQYGLPTRFHDQTPPGDPFFQGQGGQLAIQLAEILLDAREHL